MSEDSHPEIQGSDSKVGKKCFSAPSTPSSCHPRSCLYDKESRRNSNQRCVSFPEETTRLVSHVEPHSPWTNAPQASLAEIILAYKDMCGTQKIKPLSKVIKQLEELTPTKQRVAELDVHGESIDLSHCEALEEIFKRIQFQSLNFESTNLNDETAIALFDMMEYYDSAVDLSIGGNHVGPQGWQACSRMLRNCPCLDTFNVRGTDLSEGNMIILSRALKQGTGITILHLENCNLSGNSCKLLVSSLKLNTTLSELYLSDNKLNHTDAVQLCSLLMSNISLKCLDLRNNNIGDGGASFICDGLSNQPTGLGGGLTTLVLWNNNLTFQSARDIQRALVNSTSLEVLNLGRNQLTNEMVILMKETLQQNKRLLQLGLQATKLTCEGAIAIAECLVENPVLTRVDLRENNLQVAGLMALSHSMKVNSTLIRLDLDPIPKNEKGHVKEMQMQYMEYLLEITQMCDKNKEVQEQAQVAEQEDRSRERLQLNLSGPSAPCKAARKVSLTCEISPIISQFELASKNPPSPPRPRHIPHNYENESDSGDESDEVDHIPINIPSIVVSCDSDGDVCRKKLRSPSPIPLLNPSTLEFDAQPSKPSTSLAASALLALFDGTNVSHCDPVADNTSPSAVNRPQRSSAPENLCASSKPTIIARKSRFSVTQVSDSDLKYSSSAPTTSCLPSPRSRFSVTPVLSEESLTSPTIVVPRNTKPIIGFDLTSENTKKKSESLRDLNTSTDTTPQLSPSTPTLIDTPPLVNQSDISNCSSTSLLNNLLAVDKANDAVHCDQISPEKCNSNTANAKVACNGDTANETVVCNGDTANEIVACNGDTANETVACNGDTANKTVACNGNTANETVACNGDTANETVACNGDTANETEACNGDTADEKVASNGKTASDDSKQLSGSKSSNRKAAQPLASFQMSDVLPCPPEKLLKMMDCNSDSVSPPVMFRSDELSCKLNEMSMTLPCNINASEPVSCSSDTISCKDNVLEAVAKNKLITSCLSIYNGDSGIESEESFFDELTNNATKNGRLGLNLKINAEDSNTAHTALKQSHQDQIT